MELILLFFVLAFLAVMALWERRRAKASLESEVTALRWVVFALGVGMMVLACSQVLTALALRETQERQMKQGSATQVAR
jgi:uncharacterized membrane protein